MTEEEKNIQFEEALKEIETIVNDLERGTIPLEVAIDKYAYAMKLTKVCSDKLKNATEKVNKILNEKDELIEFKDLGDKSE